MSIHNSVSYSDETKLKIERSNISISYALKVGVDILSRYDLTEEAELMKEQDDLQGQIKELKNRLRLVERTLENLREQKKKDKNKDPNLKSKQKLMKALKMSGHMRNRR